MSAQSDNGVKTVETNQKHWAYHIHASRKCILVCVFGLIWCLSWAYTPQFERPGVSPSLERLAGHCKNVSPISKEEYLTRQTDLATVLASLGGTAYIAEPGANSQFFGNFSNSHWHLSERPLLLMISPVSSDALGGSIIPQVIILTPKFEATRARLLLIPSLDDFRVRYVEWVEEADPYATALAALPPPHGEGQRVVYVDDSIRKFIPDGLGRADPKTKVLSAPLAIKRLRERKSEAELGIMKCANEVTLLAIRDVHSRLYPGIRESQARSMMAFALGAAGLKDGGCLTLFGENAALPHGSGTDRTLAEADFALFDCTASLHGYWSDVTRTVALDLHTISDEHMRIWNLVHASQRVALHAARNETRTGTVDEQAREVMRLGGYDKYFTHRLGHGIGLEVHEQPYLHGGNDAIIEIGHTFSDEPGIYIEGSVGVRLEDCFYIAEDGKGVFLTAGVGGPARSPWLP